MKIEKSIFAATLFGLLAVFLLHKLEWQDSYFLWTATFVSSVLLVLHNIALSCIKWFSDNDYLILKLVSLLSELAILGGVLYLWVLLYSSENGDIEQGARTVCLFILLNITGNIVFSYLCIAYRHVEKRMRKKSSKLLRC